tara:strand:- start:1356 stop:2045 length:690 start_codon:yes stop_codon:yes gene_type:complete
MENCPTIQSEMNQNAPVPYTGIGDMVQFGTASSFAGEKITGREFGFDIVNSGLADKVVAICPANFSLLSELNVKFTADAIIKDGITVDSADITVTAHDSKNTIKSFLDYIKKTPTRVVSLALDSDNKANFTKSIELHTGVCPWESSIETFVNLRKFVSASQTQVDRTDVDLLANGTPLEFSHESVILVKVVAGSRMTFNMSIGGKMSLPAHLRNRAQLAQNYLASKGHA